MLNNKIFHTYKTTKHTLNYVPNSHSIANSTPQASVCRFSDLFTSSVFRTLVRYKKHGGA